MNDELSSGQLAEMAGVSVDTLRHYERKGVLPAPPRDGSYRRYPAASLQRVRMVRRALAIGFTLDELSRIFAVRARGEAPCRSVLRAAEEKRNALELRIAEMLALRNDLDEIIAGWRVRLAQTPEGQPARLLETLKESS